MATAQQNGHGGKLKDEREASVSPMTKSPTTGSPSMRPKLDTRDSQPRIASPLRTEQTANGSIAAKASQPNSILLPSPTMDRLNSSGPSSEVGTEFPFSSPPGVSGVLPTNDLMQVQPDGAVAPGEADDQATEMNMAGHTLSRKPTRDHGTATPRRSVQFARSETGEAERPDKAVLGHSRDSSWNAAGDNAEGAGKDRLGSQLMSKLKALTSPIAPSQGHGRSLSGWSIGAPFSAQEKGSSKKSPEQELPEPRFGEYPEDADAEESAAENTDADPSRPKRRRRFRREADEGPSTAPTTPKATRLPSFMHNFGGDGTRTPPTAPANRPVFMPRRNTMSEIPEHQRLAMSEDEGRDRLAGEGLWRRGSAWVSGHRGISQTNTRIQDPGEASAEGRRPMTLRRITGFGSNDADGSPSPWRQRGERGASLSAQRWRQIKAGLKMLGQKKQENRIDTAKSAELMAELFAGAPAALMFASMFQRDEHGHKRVPVLLEQLRVTVADSIRDDKEKHPTFRLELEYGSSLARMKWVIHRDLNAFGRLHVRYKTEQEVERYRHVGRNKERSKLPKFPKSAFPGFVGDFFSARGLKDEDSDEEQEEHTAEEQSGVEDMSGTERPGKAKRRRSSFQLMRKKSSRFGPNDVLGSAGRRPESVQERQRRKLQEYINKLITYVMFTPNSNRLCAFLEISALGMRLAAEGYHGKEGVLSLRSTRGVDFKPFRPKFHFRRSDDKWFLVRESYLVCVDSLEEMNVYDVILIDPWTVLERKKTTRKRDDTPKELAKRAKDTARHPTHHQIRVINTERKWKLTAKSEPIAAQFEESIGFIMSTSDWAKPHRFDSFAPVRSDVWAQFLVDGRDYMWNVSRAISMARDVIYIHDWWLSPQLYMRRPAAISQRWRLDRLLKRKADEGVKIYVIMYRNINTAIPIDSEYSKHSLLALNPEGKNNVFVQRSPNQLRQNTFFWAHHEKICIVDHCVAFLGGVDLCFGRWDLPSHPVVDDKPTGFEMGDMRRDTDNCQLWPGKDYSNPRVQDFFSLDKPYEEMYDRERVPRMPWHDIGMQIVGQPARDLSRHFVQRWNFLLRQRVPSRPTPFLLPPTDFLPADIEALGLGGTCEIQILRSACPWSIGTPNRTEHSIMNAYVAMIKNSEHFIYIENQFFITSCEVMGTIVENSIGDALVERITRAWEEDTDWRACILIPLMPGFQNAVDAQDGSSVRIIMECQYRSICRGASSIFGRLRAKGIEPEDYIEFYALRSFGKIGPTKSLVTEQLYIHAKVMIADDRVAIIGSANINERSMLGSRDSETAAIVRDKDLILSRMAGQDYYVARFAHNLRVRLQREHLGIDIDSLRDEELQDMQIEQEMEAANGDVKGKGHKHSHSHGFGDDEDAESVASLESDRAVEQRLVDNKHKFQEELIHKQEQLHTFNYDVDWTQANNPHIKTTKKKTKDSRVQNNEDFKTDLIGFGTDKMIEHDVQDDVMNARNTEILNDHEILTSDVATEGRGTLESPERNKSQLLARKQAQVAAEEAEQQAEILPPPPMERYSTRELGLPQVSQLPPLPIEDDTVIGGPPMQRSLSHESSHVLNPFLEQMRRPVVTPDCMQDPVCDTFFSDVWHQVAENNTKIFRQVFRCQPDNDVKNWQQYKEYTAFSARFAQSQGLGTGDKTRAQRDSKGKSGPPGDMATPPPASMESMAEKLTGRSRGASGGSSGSKKDKNHPKGTVEEWTAEQEKKAANDEPIFSEKQAQTEPQNDVENEKVDAKDFSSIAQQTMKKAPEDANATGRHRTITISTPEKENPETDTASVAAATAKPLPNPPNPHGSQRRRRRGTIRSAHRPFHAMDDDMLLNSHDAEELLKLVQGHLVVWPYDWLADADEKGQFMYAVDQLAPLEIYN